MNYFFLFFEKSFGGGGGGGGRLMSDGTRNMVVVMRDWIRSVLGDKYLTP